MHLHSESRGSDLDTDRIQLALHWHSERSRRCRTADHLRRIQDRAPPDIHSLGRLDRHPQYSALLWRSLHLLGSGQRSVHSQRSFTQFASQLRSAGCRQSLFFTTFRPLSTATDRTPIRIPLKSELAGEVTRGIAYSTLTFVSDFCPGAAGDTCIRIGLTVLHHTPVRSFEGRHTLRWVRTGHRGSFALATISVVFTALKALDIALSADTDAPTSGRSGLSAVIVRPALCHLITFTGLTPILIEAKACFTGHVAANLQTSTTLRAMRLPPLHSERHRHLDTFGHQCRKPGRNYRGNCMAPGQHSDHHCSSHPADSRHRRDIHLGTQPDTARPHSSHGNYRLLAGGSLLDFCIPVPRRIGKYRSHSHRS